MNEIKCPNCGTTFQINESEYEKIVKQIKNKEFEKELTIREKEYKLDKENEVLKVKTQIKEQLTQELNQKEIQITKLKHEVEIKETETKNKLDKEYTITINNLKIEIEKLKGELSKKDAENKLKVEETTTKKDKEIQELTSKLDIKTKEYELKEKNVKEKYESKLKDKDEQIAYYKDFKARQSTKMIGESLEQHCLASFNRLRPLFTNSYFEKDNDAKTGSKGDFIFRDYDEEGNEIVSIMFEMKNEADATATKHKNEDFLKELDKDRREKNCEYAVLVSLLEIENEYYNDGIVDVSHYYDKMYVIRPQFFIPLITLIRNLAQKTTTYKKELETIKNQNIDITHFEENILKFKDAFGRNYRLASERFTKAIEEIDKTIDHLQKTKEHLLKTNDNLRLANNKAEDLTIKKLTTNSPTVRKMFEDQNEKKLAS